MPTKAKIRIAIADDHPIFRDGLYRLLTLEEDFDVVAQVEEGLHVPEVLQQYDPDILLLDCHAITAVMRRFAANEEAPPPPLILSPAVPREHERSPLSQREGEIVTLVAQGFKNKDMAEKMLISEQTVKNHMHNIFDKLDVSDRLELALHFVAGLLQVGTSAPAKRLTTVTPLKSTCA